MEHEARPVRSLVLAPFYAEDSANNRPRQLARVLARFGPVDVVTTDFDHARKRPRGAESMTGDGHRVTVVPTPPYARNVSVSRFRSHVAFARRAAAWARPRLAGYDVVYATAPLATLAADAFAHAPSAVRILDVVDVWPDVLPFPPLVRRVGWPAFALWKRQFARACARADVLLAVSDAFLAEGERRFRGGARRRFYIGHPPLPGDADTTRDAAARRGRVAYVGNVGQLYDFDALLDALAAPERRGRFELHVVGAGDRDAWLRAELARRGIAHVHHGVVHDPTVLGPLLAACDVGFNGYRNTTASFSYKATTYLAAGLPIVNSMPGDLHALVERRGLGANYAQGDALALGAALDAVVAAPAAEIRARCRRFFDVEIRSDAVDDAIAAFVAEVLASRGVRRGGGAEAGA